VSKSDDALRELSARRRSEYLGSLVTPIGLQELAAGLELCALLDDEDVARDQAERLLLRFIDKAAVSELFYEIRRRCV
jgi:hypothetical protein